MWARCSGVSGGRTPRSQPAELRHPRATCGSAQGCKSTRFMRCWNAPSPNGGSNQASGSPRNVKSPNSSERPVTWPAQPSQSSVAPERSSVGSGFPDRDGLPQPMGLALTGGRAPTTTPAPHVRVRRGVREHASNRVGDYGSANEQAASIKAKWLRPCGKLPRWFLVSTSTISLRIALPGGISAKNALNRVAASSRRPSVV